MKDFDRLERQIFSIKPQVYFTRAFFKELHDMALKNHSIIAENIEIPQKMIEKYSMSLPINKLTLFINNKHYFNPSASHMIREYFGVEERKEANEEDSVEFKTERQILSIMTREQFAAKYPNETLQVKKDSYEFVPTTSISYSDFCTLANAYPSFRFLMNPFLIKKEYSTNSSDILQRIEVDIKRRVIPGDRFGQKVATKFSIQCKCGKSVALYPSDIHTAIKHECGFQEIDGKTKVIRTTLDKSGLCPISEKEIFLYECKIPNLHDNNKQDSVYLYSFNDNLTPGLYQIDIWNTYIWVNDSKEYNFYPIILGNQKQEIKIDTNLIINNHPDAIKYCTEHNLLYARFLDVLFSWRDACKTYAGREVSNRGMLLQLFLISTGLAKNLNKYDKLGVCVMGNKSLSKTYPSYLAGSLLDTDFQHIGSSQDASVAGLRGGINNSKLINGQTTRVFEKGVFSSAGLTLFDEGEKFFIDEEMNMVLKTFFDEYIDIKKVGAEGKIEQIYTPIIMSNFPYYHSQEYFKEVRDAYEKLIRLNDEKHEHGNSKEEIMSYVSDVNLYLPTTRYEEDYKNQTLAKAVGLVRYIFEKKNKDWRTGGSMPASYRLLLDVTCWNSEEFAFSNEDRVIGETETVLPSSSVFPTAQFVETLKANVGYKIINLKFESLNPKKDIDALNSLQLAINEWFTYDSRGQKLFMHLSGGKKEIDPKLNSVVYKFIKTLQCYEDLSTHGELKGFFTANVKEWCFLILSKCKRGITKAEYNFDEHYDNIVPRNEKFSKLEAEIEKIKNLEKTERLEDAVQHSVNRRLNEQDAIAIDPQGGLFNKS